MWFEFRFVGFKNAAKRLGAALLDGGGDLIGEFRVSDGGFLG